MKLPYGMGDFNSLIQEGYYYVDKTKYIETLESFSDKFVFFLRPRRFGKSLWISTLQAYYGVEYAKDFESLFGKLYIGSHKTALANNYYVLRFDFSGVDTTTHERAEASFAQKVDKALVEFQKCYKLLTAEEFAKIEKFDSAAGKFTCFLANINSELKQHKIYVMIDEYDHFANELLARGVPYFKAAVTQNGFVRKFYEELKEGAGQGLVNRIFVTGIAPLTLDSLTSGFNIAKNFTLKDQLQAMLGFTQSELETMAQAVFQKLGKKLDASVLANIKTWYNGYGFSQKGDVNSVYNSDMVLYFFTEFLDGSAQEPSQLNDHNVVTDYGKLKGLFSLASSEQSQEILNEIVLNEHSIVASFTEQYSFERPFTRADFVSLLFYLGFLTIEKRQGSLFQFCVPNYVILKLYYQNFVYQYLGNLVEGLNENVLAQAMRELNVKNQPEALFRLVAKTLTQLSNRDFIQFDEKYVKCIMVSFLSLNEDFYLKSEPEINHQYSDLLLIKRPGIDTPFQFLFELKYLHKKDAKNLKSLHRKAVKQVQDYLKLPEIATLTALKAWLVIFVGDKLMVCENINEEKKRVTDVAKEKTIRAIRNSNRG